MGKSRGNYDTRKRGVLKMWGATEASSRIGISSVLPSSAALQTIGISER